jgi:hypothetical protein
MVDDDKLSAPLVSLLSVMVPSSNRLLRSENVDDMDKALAKMQRWKNEEKAGTSIETGWKSKNNTAAEIMSMHQWIPYTTPPIHVTTEEETEGDKRGGATFVIAPADHTLGNMLAAAAEAHPSVAFVAARCERLGRPKVLLRIDCGDSEEEDGEEEEGKGQNGQKGEKDGPHAVFAHAVNQSAETLASLRASWSSLCHSSCQ